MSIQIGPHQLGCLRLSEVWIGNSACRPTLAGEGQVGHRRERHSADERFTARSLLCRKTHKQLDLLVMTQGIATVQGYTPTSEGIDQKLALHYYSRIAFADRLMPLLEKSDDARVLTVLSAGVHSNYVQYAEDPDLSKAYSLAKAANAAGMYNDIGFDQLAKAHPTVTFIHAAPGFVNTNWGTEMPFFIKGLVRLIQPLGTSIGDIGEFLGVPLLTAPYKRAGLVLLNERVKPVNKTSLHDTASPVVWQHTRDVLKRVLGDDATTSSTSTSSTKQ